MLRRDDSMHVILLPPVAQTTGGERLMRVMPM